LLLCLLAQACLLIPRLDLLPVWGDEHFTQIVAARSVTGVLDLIAREQNNPPLHSLLVHFWLLVPWPVSKIVAARALSVLFALAATVVIDRLWLRALERPARLWFLLLWTLSPCLVLYSRMARSYSLQLLIFALGLRAAVDLIQQPVSKRRIAVFVAGEAVLLYVHYLSGLALLASLVLILAWKALRRRQPAFLAAAGFSVLLVAALYAPWLPHLGTALGRMAGAQSPIAAAGPLMSEAVRLGYLGFSFAFGETPPLWVMACGLVVAPGVAFLALRGAGLRPAWLALAALAAIAAYPGAGRWVSFVFIPARLLFLLPFFLMLVASGAGRSPRAGRLVCAAMLCLSAGSIASYFRGADFLNKAYVLSYDEIAGLINANSGRTRAVLLADVWNTDPFPLAARIRRDIPLVLVRRGSTPDSLRKELEAAGAGVVWYFRNTHDTSSGGLNRRMENDLSRGRQVVRHLFVPYSSRDRFLMRLLGWRERPTHFIQLLEMRPGTGGAGPA